MPSGQNILGLLEKIQSSHISVNQGRCAVVRNRNAGCMRCAEVCTSGCISLVEDKLVISAEKCIGCGTCATICPTCALEAHQPDDAKLFMDCVNVMRKTDGVVTIACKNLIARAGKALDQEKVVGVTCLGRVEESLIIMLSTVGCHQVTLVADGCDACEHNHGMKAAGAVVETARALLETWSADTKVKISSKFPSVTRMQDEAYDPEKRAFLAGSVRTAKSTGYLAQDYAIEQIADKVDPRKPAASPRYMRVQADGTLPHFVPARRKRLIKGLHALGAPADVLIETRLWGHVIINKELCDSCQRCATFCPTEALQKFTAPDGTFGIVHYPSRCVKCRCCEDVCHRQAITISDEVFITDILDGSYERYEMDPLEFEPGNLRQMHERIGKLIGVEEVYDH